MSCIICNETPKYKCSVCEQPYCSVVCYKTHKEVPCQPPPPPEKDSAEERTRLEREYEFPTEDTVPLDKLKLLEKSSSLKSCLQNPHVRQILEELDKSLNPDMLIQEYMQEPIFTELVDECLKVVQPQSNE